MRFLLLSVIAFLSSSCITARGLSIKLEMTYDNQKPYLIINYCNDSNTDYYMPSLFYYSSQIPKFFVCFETKSNCLEKAKLKLSKYRNESYLIGLSYCDAKYSFLNLVRDDNKELEVEDTEKINYDLNDYYCGLYNRGSLLATSGDGFTECELSSSEFIMNSPAFVFVHAKDTVKHSIDISGLLVAGIKVKVEAPSSIPPNKIRIRYYGEPQDYVLFPPIIDGYRLYQGELKSNVLTIDFSKTIFQDET